MKKGKKDNYERTFLCARGQSSRIMSLNDTLAFCSFESMPSTQKIGRKEGRRRGKRIILNLKKLKWAFFSRECSTPVCCASEWH